MVFYEHLLVYQDAIARKYVKSIDHDSEMTLSANLRSQLFQAYHHVYSEE